MIAIIFIFLAGVLTMFSSFLALKKLPRIISLAGISAALISILLRKEFALNFIEFYSWNPMTIFMSALALFVAFFIVLNYPESKEHGDNSSVYSLLLFSLCGALLLFGYTNLITLFLGIEILSIPVYVLAASQKDNRSSLEAGLKYFILGSFSTAFLLFGIALIYGTFGSFFVQRILEIHKMGVEFPAFYHVGVLFIFIAIFFKMALAPFHFWSPDVYEGSPNMITGYMATIVKMAGTISLYYLGSGFFAFSGNRWIPIFLVVIALSLLLGSVLGMVQTNVKRLMAYSSIANAAFLIMTVLIALLFQNHAMIRFYLLVYSIAVLMIFTVLSKLKSKEELSIESLGGLIRQNRLAGIGMTLALFSLAGIPATGGFIAKYSVLSSMFTMNIYIFVLALLASALGIVYYLRVINQVCLEKVSQHSADFKADWRFNITILVGMILILILGIFPNSILELAVKLS